MTTKKPTTERKPTKWKPPQRKPTEWPPDWKPTTEWKPPKKKLITEYNLPPRKPPKEVEPLTIMKMRPPKDKDKPAPPPLPKPIKPAPRRSPTLKWRKKSR